MGLFDTILMKVACPHCGEDIDRDLQFKLRRDMGVYLIGDVVSPQFRWIDCLATCSRCGTPSVVCGQCNQKQYGEAHRFTVRVYLNEDGAVTGEYKVLRELEFKSIDVVSGLSEDDTC